MKLKLDFISILLIVLTMLLPTGHLHAAPLTSAAARVVNTSIGRDKTLISSLRDRYGFLWVGTTTGLACYDGNGESVYANASGVLPGSEGINVNSIFEWNDNIWFGGNRGLYIFDRSTNSMQRFPFKTKYGVQISSLVEDIQQMKDGKIWILTHGQGLFIFDPATSRLSQNSREGAFFSDMVSDGSQTVYCITHDGYIVAFNLDGNAIRKVRLPDFVTDKNPIGMAFTEERVWIAANRSIFAYTPSDGSVERIIPDTHHGIANSLLKGGADQLWLGTDEGIFSYRCSTPTQAPSLSEIPVDIRLVDMRVAQLSDDRNGGLIVVTRTGISFVPFDTFAVRRVETPEGDVFRTTVNTLLPSSDGTTVWLGTDHGVASYDVKSGLVTGRTLPLGADIIVTSLAEKENALWVGSRHEGLFRYDLKSGAVKRYEYDETKPYALISNGINDLCVTSAGELYVLTNWGMCRYNPDADNFSVLTETENAVPFLGMEEDAKGRLWAFTATNALYVRQPGNPRFDLFRSNAVGSHAVNLLFNDPLGRLWAVTAGNRLLKYDENEGDFIYCGSPAAKSYPITFIEAGDDGVLWISTDEGVVRFNPDINAADRTVLTDEDVYSVHGAAGKLNDGSILFGSLHGLCELSPTLVESSHTERQAFPVSISFPYADDNDAELRRLGLDRLLYTMKEIKLPYSDNTFTIHFASSVAGGAPGVRYQYMLEGVDPSWMQAAGSDVRFSHLAPGRYRLLVRADSTTEDSAVHTLGIRILPPWYLSWPAFIAYLIIIASLIWLAVIYTRRKVKKQAAAKIQEIQVRQERETYESKMRFFINLVHEIRTPLTLISLPLEQIADSVNSGRPSGKEEKGFVQSMQRNLDYLLGIINQLLDFRKAEQDSEVRLLLQSTDIAAEVADICSRFAQPLASQGKELSVEIDDSPVMAEIDKEKFDRVVMNLLGNAMKYSQSKVAVRLSASKEGYTLYISDDGKGIPEEERSRIFDTYYQIAGDNVATALGTGLGLAYARLIVRAHTGDISVEDTPGGGATFILRLPLHPEVADAPVASVNSGVISNNDPASASITPMEGNAEVTPGDKAPGENGEAGDSVKPTLLFVEDNTELRLTVANTLKDRYNVIVASDGEEALSAISEADAVDVVVSDFMMPGMDGAELCRRIKGNIDTSFIPFIMLTAKTGLEAKEEAFEAGADAFVEKPFSIRQLTAQISNIINTRHLFHEKMQSNVSVSETVAEEAPFINKMDTEFLDNLNLKIQENIFDDEFSIDSMAEQMSMSRSTFYRRMKAITGMTPVDYLKNYRLEHATRLLREGMRATEVASAVGFTSSSYFAKCFKAKYGSLPKDFNTRQ